MDVRCHCEGCVGIFVADLVPRITHPSLRLQRHPSGQTDTYNNAIRHVNLGSGLVSTMAGSPVRLSGFADGMRASALFNSPAGIAVDAAGSFALVVSEGFSNGVSHRRSLLFLTCSTVLCTK